VSAEFIKNLGRLARRQEERLAVRLLLAQYQRKNLPVPPESELSTEAAHIVGEAHRIAHQRGTSIVSILKEMIQDFKGK